MGEILLSQEIIEHVLQFADGETLLMCREVSPEFEAAVKYLGKTKNIWEKCFSKEKGDNYPYGVISKLHPHKEGFEFPKNWGLIYESCLLRNFISQKKSPSLREFKLRKEYSSILDLETHGDLMLILVKYNKDFSIYYRIVTINLQDVIVDKSSRFYANMLYVTSVDDPSTVREDAIILSCDFCQLVAVPVTADVSISGFPKFTKNYEFLTVEHSNGEILWINTFGKLISKGKCFHMGTAAEHEEIKQKDSKSPRVFQKFTTVYISWGEIKREFNSYKELHANVTASLIYAELLLLGTNTGMLYAYILKNEAALEQLSLKSYSWQFDICCNSILVMDIIELKHQIVIVCCSEKSVYHIHINRKLHNLNAEL